MKYVGGHHESIRKELKFFKVEDISEASMKVIGIEEKNLPMESKKSDKFRKGGKNLERGTKSSMQLKKIIAVTITSMDILRRSAGSFTLRFSRKEGRQRMRIQRWFSML